MTQIGNLQRVHSHPSITALILPELKHQIIFIFKCAFLTKMYVLEVLSGAPAVQILDDASFYLFHRMFSRD